MASPSSTRSAQWSQRLCFRQRVRNSDLPQPRYNVFLRAADGTDIGEADAWWADAGVSAEIDSREYHFYRDGWLKTDAKHSRMLKYGILPHHFAPTRIDNDWPAVYGDLRSSIHEGWPERRKAGYAKRPRRMPGPLTLGPVRWSPPRREAHRGSSRTVFREGDIRCGPGDPRRTGTVSLTRLRVSLFLINRSIQAGPPGHSQ